MACGEGVVWSLHKSVTFNQLRALASSCNPATYELPMLEIYNHGANSHLFNLLQNKFQLLQKLLGFKPGTPVFWSQPLAVLMNNDLILNYYIIFKLAKHTTIIYRRLWGSEKFRNHRLIFLSKYYAKFLQPKNHVSEFC